MYFLYKAEVGVLDGFLTVLAMEIIRKIGTVSSNCYIYFLHDRPRIYIEWARHGWNILEDLNQLWTRSKLFHFLGKYSFSNLLQLYSCKEKMYQPPRNKTFLRYLGFVVSSYTQTWLKMIPCSFGLDGLPLLLGSHFSPSSVPTSSWHASL